MTITLNFFVSNPEKIKTIPKFKEGFYNNFSENSVTPAKSFDTSALKSLTDIENYNKEERGSNLNFFETRTAPQHFIVASKQVSRFVKHNYSVPTQLPQSESIKALTVNIN